MLQIVVIVNPTAEGQKTTGVTTEELGVKCIKNRRNCPTAEGCGLAGVQCNNGKKEIIAVDCLLSNPEGSPTAEGQMVNGVVNLKNIKMQNQRQVLDNLSSMSMKYVSGLEFCK